MTQPFDLLVIGAGIVGSAVARECARSGLRVGIVDGGVPGGAASGAGMGHIVVMDDSPAQLALTRFSRDLWDHESPHLPSSIEYETRGTIWVAADDEEMQAVEQKHSAFAAAGVVTEVLSSTALSQLEPKLRSLLPGGLLVPGDAVLYPPAAAQHFIAGALQADAELIREDAISVGRHRVRLRSGSELCAGAIVLASGTDRTLIPGLPVQPRKGHLVITDRYPGFVHHQLLELGYLKSAHSLATDSVAFNIQPRRSGQLLIGSSRQFGATRPSSEAAIVSRMLVRACEYMPDLARVSTLRVWTGFRAATADKLPLIGPATDFVADDSLWLAVGFEGLGITNAPGAARLVTDAILGRDSPIDRAPYLPVRSRFEVMEPALV